MNPVMEDSNKEIHERLKLARERRGYASAKEAASAMSVSYPTYAGHENGSRGIKRQDIVRYAIFFGVTPNWLQFGATVNDQKPILPRRAPVEELITKVHAPLGARDLPVFAAVEGGDGDLVVSTEPVDLVPRPWYLGEVKDGYGVIVTGESMYPAYEPGDTAIVNPRLPYMRGKIHIFTAESENSHFKATIKKLIGVTATHWKVEQFNPPHVFELDRKIWTNARRVVGKYNG